MSIKLEYTPTNEGGWDSLEKVTMQLDTEIWNATVFVKRLNEFIALTGHSDIKLVLKGAQEDKGNLNTATGEDF